MKRNLITVLTFLICFSGIIYGQIIHIPGDYPSIQEGIDAASEGDTVLVAEGTYYENLAITGKAITLASHYLLDGDTSHISKTIINGSEASDPQKGTVLTVVNVNSTSFLVAGFTLSGGSGSKIEEGLFHGGGILMIFSCGTIRNNIIEKNSITTPPGQYGGSTGIGARLGESDTIFVHHNVIRENEIHSDEVALGATVFEIVGKNAVLHILDNTISHNITTSTTHYTTHGGGMYIELEYSFGADVRVYNNTIAYNELRCIASSGGGIYIVYPNDYPVTFTDTQVWIYNNLIHHNYSQEFGGGIAIWNFHKHLDPSLDYPPDPVLINNTIINNIASDGAGIFNYDATAVLINNILWDSLTSETGREIFQDSITGYDYYPGPYWPVEDNQGILHLYNNCLRGGWVSGLENEWEGTWLGTGNFDADPILDMDSFDLLEESYCIGNAVDSVKIEDTWYSFPKLDFHRNVRPHPIDSYPDIGASESSFAQNPLPDNTPVLTTRNIVMQVYPNPFEDLITLRLHEDGSYRIKILSLTGQLIKCEEFKGNDHQVDLVGIPSGIYIISISSEEFRSIKKVMKL